MDRQREKNGGAGHRALRRRLPDPDPATVGFNNGAADRQAHAHAVFLGAVEGLEQARHHAGRDAGAGVADADQQRAVAVRAALRLHRQHRLAGTAAGHGLDRVHQQVDEHLLQLHAVAVHRRQVRRQAQHQRHVMVIQLAPHHVDALLHHRLQVQRGVGGVAAARQRADALDDAGGAGAGLEDAGDGGLGLVQFRPGAVQPAQAGLAVGRYRRQRLIDLVRDRRRQFAQHGHPGGVRQLHLRAVQRLLGQHRRRNVGQRAEVFALAVLVVPWARQHVHVFQRAVGHQQAVADVDVALAAQRLVDGRLHDVAVFRRRVGQDALQRRLHVQR
ncbi:conserved hypothetical protein, partial [Ricinus communis]